MDVQSLYQEAIKFAAAKHAEKGQLVPGTNLPYVVHLSNVAMEVLLASHHTGNFDLQFAVQVALLHDTLEDTSTDFTDLENQFGPNVAEAVSALTKNDASPKDLQMQDSLNRVKLLQKEVWSVKMADRITNLQPPPSYWDKEKIIRYQEEAKTILHELKEGNAFLAKRLEEKIEEYGTHIHR